jgi:polyhydroxybutyrate depolymerase
MNALKIMFFSLSVICCGNGGGKSDTQTFADITDMEDCAADMTTDAGKNDSAGNETGMDLQEEEGSDTSDIPADSSLPESIGGKRPALVHLPEDYSPAKSWPLIILLHGYSVNGFLQDMYLGISERATEFGFIEVVPDGTKDKSGNLFWNAMPACCDYWKTGVDDVSYIKGLIKEAETVFNIDSDRVYLIGHSNGAFMAHRMACEYSEEIAAIASIAGSTFSDKKDCSPKKPVSLLQIHGTEDDAVIYDGSSMSGTDYPGAEKVVEMWKEFNNCKADPVEGKPADYDDAVPSAETLPVSYSACDQGTGVDLWKMNGTGHLPAFNDNFKDALLSHILEK